MLLYGLLVALGILLLVVKREAVGTFLCKLAVGLWEVLVKCFNALKA
jgi:hypothetical protein